MGDRTSATVSIRKAPPWLVKALRDDAESFIGFEPDRVDLVGDDGIDLELHEVSVGINEDIGPVLNDIFDEGLTDYECRICKGTGKRDHVGDECLACCGEGYVSYPPTKFAWKVEEAPFFGELGVIVARTPDESAITRYMNEDGDVVVTREQIIDALERVEGQPQHEIVDNLFGWHVLQHFTDRTRQTEARG